MYQLPGPAVRTVRTANPGLIFLVLFTLAALAGGAFVVHRSMAPAATTTATPRKSPQAPPGLDPAGHPPDLFLHLDHLSSKLATIGLESRKAQDLLRVVNPDRGPDQRRLWSADAALEKVNRAAEEGLKELQLLATHTDHD